MLVCKMVLGKPKNCCCIDDGLSIEAQAPSAPPTLLALPLVMHELLHWRVRCNDLQIPFVECNV